MRSTDTKWLIHYSGDDYWNGNTAVRHHISSALHAAGYNILWINPIGFRIPSIASNGVVIKVWRKTKSLAKLLRRQRKGWYVFTPIQWPFSKAKRIAKINTIILKVQLSLCKIILRIHHPIVLHSTPTFASMLGQDGARRIIYYYSDQYTLYRELNASAREWMERLDMQLKRAADAVICCSLKLYNHLVEDVPGHRLVYFPHRVDLSKFKMGNRQSVPLDLEIIAHPRIGYYGTLSDSNDWETIRYCAERRPAYQFVFIGRKDIKSTGTEHLPNVHFLGKKAYDTIHQYGGGFDVAIMFWVRREWIKHCSPLKLKEYLAMGKPVVSTVIEQVINEYPDIVYSAETPEEFLQSLDCAVAGDNTERIHRGLMKVSRDTWSDIVPYITGDAR